MNHEIRWNQEHQILSPNLLVYTLVQLMYAY